MGVAGNEMTNSEAKLNFIDRHRISNYIPLILERATFLSWTLPSTFASVSEIVVRTVGALSFVRSSSAEDFVIPVLGEPLREENFVPS